MEKDFVVFNNKEFGNIRTLEIDGKLYFVGKDIANALGYSNPRDAISRHCKGVVKHDSFKEGGQPIALISEGDMYRLITHSKLESADRFETWVFDDVLPSIRMTGTYSTPKSKPDNAAKRLEIMEANARTRQAKLLFQMSQVNTKSENYKDILIAKAAEVIVGEPVLPLPKSERRVYTAKEIGDMFGLSANKVGRIANENGMKNAEFGEYRRDKSRHSAHECDTWVYFDAAVRKFREIIKFDMT